MGIQINGQTDTISASDGSLSTNDLTINNLTGVAATFTGVITYEDVTNIDSIGIITARSDISIADKIIHTGDTDTAIRFPGADIFTVETGGSERFRINSSGAVGIGTNIPGTLLGFPVGEDIKISQVSATPHIAANVGSLGLTISDGGGHAGVYVNNTHNGTYSSQDISFLTSEGGISAATERMRIIPSGTAIFKGGTAEKFQSGTTLSAASGAVALSSGNVALFTSNESGNQTVNFTGVHATLSSGENVSFTVIITPNGSGAINALQIDSVAQTIQWSGGSAPSAGASGKDIYTFTLFKTGSGTTDYQVFGAATNYA